MSEGRDEKEAKLEVPRYWPILYALYRLKRISNSFDLQKYLYLAKRDGNAPIDYAFAEDCCGRPYCTSIKQDAFTLGGKKYINVSSENGWVFEITDDGVKQVEDFMLDWHTGKSENH